MSSTTISLTFDDGYDSHLDVVIPLLNQLGLRGTFYVDFLSTSMDGRCDEWRRAAATGHELGNHSLFHPGYPPAAHVCGGNNLADYTLERMRLELQVASKALGGLDRRTERTFAYPSGNPVLGDVGYAKRLLRWIGGDRTRLDGWVDRLHIDFGATLENYTSVVRPLFQAARGRMPLEWPQEYDRYFVPSYDADGKTLAELRGFVERMVANGTWGVITFHRIDRPQTLSVDRDDLERFVADLARDSRIAVKTFLEGSRDLWPTETAPDSQDTPMPRKFLEGSVANVGVK